jgi:hypothetical protein
MNVSEKSINPKLLPKAQRLALEHLWHGPLTRNAKNWSGQGGREHGLGVVSRLRLMGLAKNGKAGRCYITEKGKACVRRMLAP